MKLASTPATTNCRRAERSDKFLISSAILRRKLRDVARSNSSSMMIIRVPATGQADQSHAWAKAAWRPSDRRDLRRLRLMSPSARSRPDKAAVSGLEQTATYRQNRCQRPNFDRAPDTPHPAQRQTGSVEEKLSRCRSEAIRVGKGCVGTWH